MITEELRDKILDKLNTDPNAALKELGENPQFLKAILSDHKQKDEQLKLEKNERVKYIQMNANMNTELQKRAEQLQMSQGLLIGVGLLWFLRELERGRRRR